MPDDPPKVIKELFDFAKNAKVEELKATLKAESFSLLTIDAALRISISNTTFDRKRYLESVKELLQHCDINYRSIEDGLTTIIMLVCSLNEFFLVEFLMGYDYSSNFEKGERRLNMNLKDSNNRSLLHHLFSLDKNFITAFRLKSEFNSEINILHIFNFLTAHLEEELLNQNKKKKKKSSNSNSNFNLLYSELSEKDNDGYNALSLCLMRGYYNIAKQIINLGVLKAGGIAKHEVTFNGFNLLHCAVYGKNINCLYLILSYCVTSDMLHKNRDNLTPADYAKSLNLNYFHKVLKFFENNLNNPYSSKHLNFFEPYSNVNRLLTEVYSTEKYDEAMFVLDKMKLSNSLCEAFSSPSQSNDQSISSHIVHDIAITWNRLICLYSKQKKELFDLTSKSNSQIKAESILSKFVSKGDTKPPEETLFLRLNTFFNSQISRLQNEHFVENPNLLLSLYNKVIFLYKTSNYSGCIKSCCEILSLLKSELHNSINESLVYFLYVNTSLILIEVLLIHNFVFLATIFIDMLEAYLEIKKTEKSKEKTIFDDHVSKYLMSIDCLFISKSSDEVQGLLSLIKANRDLIPSYNSAVSNHSHKYLSQYEEIEQGNKSRSLSSIFKLLQIFQESIKLKILYFEGNSLRCNKLLSDIFHKTSLKSFSNQYSKEVLLFYYNSSGIVNLKQKNYFFAEFYFKKALESFELFAFSNSNDYTFVFQLGSIQLIKFNLGLAYFYQKKFQEAYNVFNQLRKSTNSQIANYPYVWFRFGLSCLELFRSAYSDNNATAANDSKGDPNFFFKNCRLLKAQSPNFLQSSAITLNYKRKLTESEEKLILEASSSFKQLIIFLTDNSGRSHILGIKALADVQNLIPKDYKDKEGFLSLINPNSGSNQKLIILTYLNLLFTLHLLEFWNEILFYTSSLEHLMIAREYDRNDSSLDEAKDKISSFKVQALICLGYYDKAHEELSKLIQNYSNTKIKDFKMTYLFNKQPASQEISFKVSLQLSLVTHFYNKGEIDAGDKILFSLIEPFTQGTAESDFPCHFINFLIFSLLHKGKIELVIKIVKYRKVFEVLKDLNIIK